MIEYSKKWFRFKKRPIDILSIEDAKSLHDAGELYTALIKDKDKYISFIEVNLSEGFIGVSWLDDKLREKLAYSFQKSDNSSRLFLSTAMYWEYMNESNDFIRSSRYTFDINGKVFVEVVNTDEQIKESFETHSDISCNWEDTPSFGEYKNLLKRERKIKKNQ